MNSGTIARLFLLAILFLLLTAGPAFAQATINVDATCSLAEAIGNANDDAQTNSDCEAGSGADTIVLRRNVELTAHAPQIDGTLTIDGRGRTIDGMSSYRPINIVETGADITIRDITITKSASATTSQGQKEGGAIRLTLPSSPDTQNGSLTLNRVRLINNAGATNGGAVSCSRANLTISDSVFANNSAAGSAGALSVSARCKLIIRRSAFHGNSAPNGGGAILTHNGAQGILIVNSAFYNNRSTSSSSGNGGAIQIDGAIYDDAIKLHHLTITGNSTAAGQYSGAAIYNRDFNVKVHLRNSILWGNTGAEQCSTKAPANMTLTNNIVQAHTDDNCGTASNADPRLPASPTGSVPYFALPDGSPAINAAPDCSSLTTEDQRGRPRPYPTGGRCDVGAYEWHPPPAPPREEKRESGSGDSYSSPAQTADAEHAAVAIPAIPAPSTCETLPGDIQVTGTTESTQCRRVSGMHIGDDELATVATDAVDVWSWVVPDTKVCFEGDSGSLHFLDAANVPRSPASLEAFSENGMVCGMIDRPGTVVLSPGPAAPAAQSSAPAAPQFWSQSLPRGCMAMTTHILNFRSAPNGDITDMLPAFVTLTAEERTDGWVRVDYHGAKGWVSASFVQLQDCG